MTLIYLDAKVESDLDWRKQLKLADSTRSIIWDLDLGFFDKLRKPIDDEAQYRSLRLALDHFVQKIWTPFAPKTQAVRIYNGNLSQELPIEYLVELVELLPDEIKLIAEVTTNNIPSLMEKAYLLSSTRFGRIEVKHDAPFCSAGKIGVLIPAQKEQLSPSLEEFLQKNAGVRLVSEKQLTLEWNELDELHVFHAVEPTIKRKIMGFTAAGGQVSFITSKN